VRDNSIDDANGWRSTRILVAAGPNHPPTPGGSCTMTAADITLAAFTLCNSLRVVAYLPQITRAARDRGGAQSVSFATWSLFLFSNVSAVAYALVNKGDWTMASMFLANAVGCTAILLIGAWKRARHRCSDTQAKA
jgi:hypothetical protein